MKKFIGGYLIEDGALTLEELDRGLMQQLEWAQEGRVLRIGEVLLELNLITPEQLERALERQAQEQGK